MTCHNSVKKTSCDMLLLLLHLFWGHSFLADVCPKVAVNYRVYAFSCAISTAQHTLISLFIAISLLYLLRSFKFIGCWMRASAGNVRKRMQDTPKILSYDCFSDEWNL